MIIPKQLMVNCKKASDRKAWLENLPVLLEELTDRWSLVIEKPFDHSGSCSWVAPAVRADGTEAVVKLAMPHMEGAHEIEGLRFWNGDATVKLLEADDQRGAMLLERCRPGTTLRSEPEAKQDEVIATLLRRLWRLTSQSNGFCQFRHLSEMLEIWQQETLAQIEHWSDAKLVRGGLRVFRELARPASTDTLLVTDLHAGNVLRAEREPWLMIDPKPFIGDVSYDLVQHLINCEDRLHADPISLIKRLAELAEIDAERLRLWTFARVAAEPREDWNKTLWLDIGRALSP
jgi:streptomycin 6-kinase